jgi:dihydropteroate synthase
MVGVSPKTMIYKTIGETAADALNVTTAFHAIALPKGANILCAHDVKGAVEAVKIFMMCK